MFQYYDQYGADMFGVIFTLKAAEEIQPCHGFMVVAYASSTACPMLSPVSMANLRSNATVKSIDLRGTFIHSINKTVRLGDIYEIS